ncbi:hypothetical protein I308_104510 [Cryptococcus tetragattii IND107]|uniref:Elongator complex protein 5 n=1 Tax=Cryptococcus tetragattii IND107 TaxID=1296105 RepID=A0ABR3BMT4_9TREE|nr:hypothetical protein I308_01098 [Cryptococcus tetragattii IND107]
MTYLTAHLPFQSSSPLPPPGSHLIISDTLNSPAQFALYHLVNAALLKQKSQSPSITQARQTGNGGTEQVNKVVWVDFRGEGRSSWEAVLKKLGTPLPPSTSPTFIHITPSSLPACIPSSSTSNANSPRIFPPLFPGAEDTTSERDGRPTLKQVYDVLRPHLQTQARPQSRHSLNPGQEGEELQCLLILDGVSDLLSIGVSAREIHRFVRAVYAQTMISKTALVSTLHTDSLSLSSLHVSMSEPETETTLLERLLKTGHGVWWRIENLHSGRSGDVMGEISSHPFGTYHLRPNFNFGRTETDNDTYIPRSKPLQYRLEPSTVRVFAKGTGRGFL